MGEQSGDANHRHLAVGLAEKVEFLSQPHAYAGAAHTTPTEIVPIETHMAWVFLSGDYAYKLKKPVFRPDQDFSTIDARQRDNLLELSLNRRLAEDIYLAQEPLNVDANGAMSLSGAGQPCDWLIKMRRLERSKMLDARLPANRFDPNDADRIARRLKAFYAQREPVAMSFEEYRTRFRGTIEQNARFIGGQQTDLQSRITKLAQRQLEFIDAHASEFDDALRRERVVEAHGDLRPEHVCVDETIRVIDCLEFFRDYRLQDWADDVAFLALECERLGHRDFGQRILAGVAKDKPHGPSNSLIAFYQCYRASIRARLALRHLTTGYSDDRQKWISQTNEYLELAEAALLRSDP